MHYTLKLSVAQRFYTQLDYARHFPKSYVDRMKRTIPKKIYDNRFGASPVIRWSIPPDDYLYSENRPWESEFVHKALRREVEYRNALFTKNFFVKTQKEIKKIPDEEWIFFPGDFVQVLVGKDKGKQGIVSRILRDINAVFVDGLHTVICSLKFKLF